MERRLSPRTDDAARGSGGLALVERDGQRVADEAAAGVAFAEILSQRQADQLPAAYAVWLPGGNEPPDEFSVEGRLRIIQHPPCKLHAGFIEYCIIAGR